MIDEVIFKSETNGLIPLTEFDWKTEFLYNIYELPGSNVKSKGFYTSVQNKLNSRFWVGGRIGYSELPYDNKQSEWDFTACVDFWQSEFVFFRLQYQYSSASLTRIRPHLLWVRHPTFGCLIKLSQLTLICETSAPSERTYLACQY